MKMLIFDFRDSEKDFFNRHSFPDFDITFINKPLNELTVLTDEQWEETDIVSVFINSVVSETVINKFKNLRIVATRSTGYNHIDLKCCTQNNIAVFNVEQYGQGAVAEFTIGVMLVLIRKILPAYLDIQKENVNHPDYEGRNLKSLTLGLIGCGAIGGAVAKLAKVFGMKILTYSYSKNSDVQSFVDFVSLDELLEKSDVISLHIPYTNETYHILGDEEFKKMKQGVYIINTSRGELIDTKLLYENLLNGKISGVALDVLECEYETIKSEVLKEDENSQKKCAAKALVNKKLFALENVLITPHIAYNTKESVDMLLEHTFNNIRDYIKGEHNSRLC